MELTGISRTGYSWQLDVNPSLEIIVEYVERSNTLPGGNGNVYIIKVNNGDQPDILAIYRRP